MVYFLTGNKLIFWVQGIHINYFPEQYQKILHPILYSMVMRLSILKLITGIFKNLLHYLVITCTNATNLTECFYSSGSGKSPMMHEG